LICFPFNTIQWISFRVYGDKGNFYATHPCSTAIEVYNIEKDQWRTLACTDLPILKWPGACVTENFAFVIGGKHTDGKEFRIKNDLITIFHRT
jgi:hypothetical protein